MKFNSLDFRKFSNWVLRTSTDRVKVIRAFSTASTVKLYNLANLSIQSILGYFYTLYQFTSHKYKQWHYLHFVRPKGIAFVGGLQYTNDIHTAFLKIVNKNPGSRFYNLGAIFQAIDSPPQIKLFMDVDKKDFAGVTKILASYLTKSNEMSIPDAWDLIRAFLGPMWLIKKVFRKDLYTVFVGVMDPKEAEWLRKKGYYLVYLQANEMKSRWERGYSYCAISYDLTLFEGINEQAFLSIFSRCGLRM